MGIIIMLTGGARSGKSMYAQKFASAYDDVAYIATAINTDGEMLRRIEKHREQRPTAWQTYEEPYEIADVLRKHDQHEVYLIDCISAYITNLLLREKDNWNENDILQPEEQTALERLVDEKIEEVLELCKTSKAHFIFVTNEVGMGLVPINSLGRLFRDVVGRANRQLAEQAHEVYLVVSGILMPLKGGK